LGRAHQNRCGFRPAGASRHRRTSSGIDAFCTDATACLGIDALTDESGSGGITAAIRIILACFLPFPAKAKIALPKAGTVLAVPLSFALFCFFH
jgi:hypothetical protein